MFKKDARIEYKKARQMLDHSQLKKLDDLLLLQLQRLSFEPFSYLLSYFPIERLNEPGTKLLHRYMLFMYPEIEICVPRTNFDDASMDAVLLDEDSSIQKNIYGINEPLNGTIIDPQNIDIVFVPLLVCDKKGYRVGYGKGFYDRYFEKCRKDVIKIGISYFDPIDTIEDLNEYDIALNYCITPNEVIEF